MFIIAITRARHLSLHWATSIQLIPYPISQGSILILSFHLRLGFQNGLLPTCFPTKILYCASLHWNITLAANSELQKNPEAYVLTSACHWFPHRVSFHSTYCLPYGHFPIFTSLQRMRSCSWWCTLFFYGNEPLHLAPPPPTTPCLHQRCGS